MTSVMLEQFVELLLQPRGEFRLRDEAMSARFRALAPRYRQICDALLHGRAASDPHANGYDWASLVAHVRRSFHGRVPARFLSHPVLRRTMVFARGRGVRVTEYRVRFVETVYGENVARTLLREDPIGAPAITDLRTLTSANRAHHAMHLAAYRRATQSDFWDASTAIEWGGGYGNMARLVRRMNPKVTYIIIDLPEISALQYVYLGSIEGEDAIHLVDPDRFEIRAGKINLLSAYDLRDGLRADAFLSTWGLTESPADAQRDVVASDYFGARHVLTAAMNNENNLLRRENARLGLQCVPIEAAASLGDGNEYWFR